jgi:hypothetical protein
MLFLPAQDQLSGLRSSVASYIFEGNFTLSLFQFCANLPMGHDYCGFWVVRA